MKRTLYAIIILMLAAGLAFGADSKDSKKPKTAKDYISDLSSNDEQKICEAADWLGKEEEKGAVASLKKLLTTDSRVKVRIYAAMALGLIGDKTASKELENKLLSDSSADVRYTCILAITRLGIEDKTKGKQLLDKVKATESDPFVLDYVKKVEELFGINKK